MLELEGINIWVIVVVWFIFMAVGAWWYSTAGFAKQWTKYTGINILEIPTKQANMIISSVAASSLIQAFTLAVLFNSLRVASIVEGLLAGLLIWFGLVTATTVGVTLYSKRSWRFLWLNSAYFLVVISIASVVYAVWQ